MLINKVKLVIAKVKCNYSWLCSSLILVQSHSAGQDVAFGFIVDEAVRFGSLHGLHAALVKHWAYLSVSATCTRSPIGIMDLLIAVLIFYPCAITLYRAFCLIACCWRWFIDDDYPDEVC